MLSYKGLTLVRNLGRTRAAGRPSDPSVLEVNPKGFSLEVGPVSLSSPGLPCHRLKSLIKSCAYP